MKWETYEKLSTKLKDEYNFRFKEDIELPINSMFSWTIILVLLIMCNFYLFFIIITNPAFVLYKPIIKDIFVSINMFINIMALTLIIVCIEFIIKSIFRLYQYSKWKKENNIKEIFWYNKWLK